MATNLTRRDPEGVVRPSLIKILDKSYVRSGKWQCAKSPTGAHHSVESKCIHCGKHR